MKSLAGKLTVSIGVLTLLLATCLFYATYRMADQKRNEVIVRQAEMALQYNLAARKYIAEQVRPMMYDRLGKDEFI